MSFLDELQKNTNYTRTENDAVTNRSTLNPLLDFFSMAGAMRDNIYDAVTLFEKAYLTDKQTAVRTLFYIRDIRGGQGERDIFRYCFKRLLEIDSLTAIKVVQHIPEYGRWDDAVVFIKSDVGETVSELIGNQLVEDEDNKRRGNSVSLLAKWLPSENASSRNSRSLAREVIRKTGMTPKKYRKKLSALRSYIDVLEQKMTLNQWGEVVYENLPSQAMRKHTKAFRRHDEERFEKYLEAVDSGEKTINTQTVYTYEIFDMVKSDPKAAATMWENLPDFTGDDNSLVVADVSGSMTGRPMSVSVSLALYFAERNTGIFHDCFLTFTERPQVVTVQGEDLVQRLSNIENREWGFNTNIEAVFDAVLDASRKSPEDTPKVIYIISDMEFDRCTQNPSETNFDKAQRKFQEAGLELPHLVFWNVEARQVQSPATKFDNRVTLISGLSQSTFRYVVEGKTPEELMEEVVNSDRYAPIVI